MLIATSGTSSTFSRVCFVVLFLTLLAGEKMTTGGLVLNKLKKLNGLRFTFPFLSTVDAKQIGREPLACLKNSVPNGVLFYFNMIVLYIGKMKKTIICWFTKQYH